MATATPDEMAGWPAPNFANPESRAGIVLGFTAPSMALVIIFTAMRFYGRGVLRQVLGVDDWMMLGAAVFSIPVSAIALESLNLGLGLHIWDQKEEWHEPYSKMAFAADILFPISVSLTKISLCLTYLRLFPSRIDKIFCYVLSTFVTLYTIVCLFLMLFQCTPIKGYWDRSISFRCIDMRATLISIAALNSLSDFLVYLWPAKPLWSLQLPKKQRVGLIFLFGVGCVVCIAGIIRMYYLEVYFDSYDVLWNASPVYAVMAAEMNLGIVCGCLSGIKPILVLLFPRFFGSSNKTPTTHPTAYAGSRSRRATRPESFPFQPLSDKASSLGKVRDLKEHNVTITTLDREHKKGRNFAWASASGNVVESGVPSNAIKVETVVVREEGENLASISSSNRSVGKGDGESEEWIMDEVVPARGGG